MDNIDLSNNCFLAKSDILHELRKCQNRFSQRGISWTIAKEINVNFAEFKDVCTGTFEVELLLKIWNTKFPILHCYFCDLNNENNLFILNAFKNRDEIYSANDRSIDISYENLGNRFSIDVGLTKTFKNKWNRLEYLK